MTSTATQSQALLVQLLDPANRPDPYPLLRQIRERGPLRLPESNLVVFSSLQDCGDVLRHPSSASDRLKSAIAQREIAKGAPARPFGQPGFLFLDPPDHTRLRKLAQQAFAPKVVRALEPDVTAMVEALLDEIDPAAGFDAVTELAHPLPVAVICRMLGVPLQDEPEFSRASALLAQGLDPFFAFTGAVPDDFEDRLQAGQWLRGYLADLIEQRRSVPREDLISALIAAEEDGDQLTTEEIVATCNLLLVAGHETTVNLIANAILAMLRHPEHWAALATDADRAPAIVEETLRWDPPVQLAGRFAAEDMEIGGVAVPKGETMMVLLAAAQRDPAAFDRPDAFDPSREGIRHLAFGHGVHFCLGAPLARLEARIALSAVAARFPNAALAAEPLYRPNVTLRGMSSLPVAV
ncbi:cytochrome P450 [Mycolicibacterium sp. 050158]|jgi:cytochrome P450|uniref:cytochrome P450 n=1 Tax=Mycolicibacterium sp. 050158 TaxID=3090602 RepID=UPI00299D8F98|nr:cytochrome P450 [Mycolicibacterium sp. 050158]MDX1889666.1 cytochrome P450 [Mycolicibacterium sp. 050158]